MEQNQLCSLFSYLLFNFPGNHGDGRMNSDPLLFFHFILQLPEQGIKFGIMGP